MGTEGIYGSGLFATDSMAYVGETPWHSLGHGCGENATWDELYEKAFNWSVSKESMITVEQGLEVPNRFAVVRDDTKTVLGVVGKNYNLLQNSEVIDILKKLEPYGLSPEIAGSLFEGVKVWALA